MNTNLLHNILNLLGLIVGALVLYDWSALGLDATTAATLSAGFLLADKVIKLSINILRDGIGGLVKAQPPVVDRETLRRIQDEIDRAGA